MPELKVREYMDTLATDFVETPFVALGDEWESALEDIFEDTEE